MKSYEEDVLRVRVTEPHPAYTESVAASDGKLIGDQNGEGQDFTWGVGRLQMSGSPRRSSSVGGGIQLTSVSKEQQKPQTAARFNVEAGLG